MWIYTPVETSTVASLAQLSDELADWVISVLSWIPLTALQSLLISLKLPFYDEKTLNNYFIDWSFKISMETKHITVFKKINLLEPIFEPLGFCKPPL